MKHHPNCVQTKWFSQSERAPPSEALSRVALRCITALRAGRPAFPRRVDAEDNYPGLIFHRHFEPEASLAEQALQTAGLVALFTT